MHEPLQGAVKTIQDVENKQIMSIFTSQPIAIRLLVDLV
jgi:hypothetical protein